MSRKAFELPLAYVMSLIWPKERMIEVYLNVAQFGPGIYGAEEASRYYFRKSAAELTRHEARSARRHAAQSAAAQSAQAELAHAAHRPGGRAPHADHRQALGLRACRADKAPPSALASRKLCHYKGAHEGPPSSGGR